MPGMNDLAATVLDRLTQRLSAARDPARAAAMSAYMRGQFPYFGVPAPGLRAIEKAAFAGLPAPAESDLRAVAVSCWSRPEREFQYAACDFLIRHRRAAGPHFLATLPELIRAKPWWDTTDPLATRVVGDLVRRHPTLLPEMDAWSTAENMWLVRTAILHQLHFGEATDTQRLFGYCARQADHPDFFIRKAIGWALRQHARTDPSAVRSFLEAHKNTLSPLSTREAAKHL